MLSWSLELVMYLFVECPRFKDSLAKLPVMFPREPIHPRQALSYVYTGMYHSVTARCDDRFERFKVRLQCITFDVSYFTI